MRSLFLPTMLCFVIAIPIRAQHHMHHMEHGDSTMEMDSTMPITEHSHHGHHVGTDNGIHTMSAITSLSLPMTRNGSGTGWQPDASPMYAYMNHDLGDGWQLMVHGSLFATHTWTNLNNNNRRGGNAFVFPSFFMAMAQRPIGSNGLLGFEAMLSLDPALIGGAGYPLLFQTGETWQNIPLVDKQHPHDFVATLAALYTHRLSDQVDVSAYLGYPGEPALGPTAFMHRASSIANPDAPLGHHWMDATHIVFGVGTIGVRYGTVKFEASVFTGREPDEHRYTFDKPLFDSRSWRISWAPNKNMVAQISQGYLTTPEPTSAENVVRTTASLQAAYRSSSAWWSGILAAGLNNAGEHHREYALLAEVSVDLNGTIPFLRAEWVQKTSEELQLPVENDHSQIQNIGAVSLGIARQLLTYSNTGLSVGMKATVNVADAALDLYYGSTPLSAMIFIRLTPARL